MVDLYLDIHNAPYMHTSGLDMSTSGLIHKIDFHMSIYGKYTKSKNKKLRINLTIIQKISI